MSEPFPSKNPKNAPAEAATADLPFELMVRELWAKPENRTTIYTGIVVVLLGIIGWGGYREVQARREAGVEAGFAAATTPAKLQAFVRENETHPLAGAAYLQLGDEAYAAARFDEARTDYEKAAAVLPGTPFAARATLGEGICLLQTGKVPEGLALLQRLATDTAQLPAVRCEAAYHLAAVAFSNRQFDDVVKFTNLIGQVDPNGIWAQRAVLLQMRTPASAAAPAAAPAPAPGAAAPSMAIKVPGT
ncbi:MAG TPA: tetratricopeptide repeat protein [Opitutaceae bacterium]|nr:tetratricopeptide repeat protein [Opitutaceae bacterium]